AVFEGSSLTYSELDRRANELARRLRALGVEPEAPVGLCLERSFDLLVGALGILKAGGAYVPLDPDYPRDRLAFMLSDSGTGVVVTDPRLNALPSDLVQKLVFIHDTQERTEAIERGIGRRNERRSAPPEAGPHNLAYLVYTSGSSGRPKGVAVEHGQVLSLVKGADYARLGENEGFLQPAPISFHASVFEIWGCLLNGGQLRIAPAGALSLEELGREIAQGGVTTLWLTASLFHQMVDHQLDALRGLHQLLAGGDVLSVLHVRRAFEALEGCRIVNGYGPTEGTTFTSCWQVNESVLASPTVPIGRPIEGRRCYTLSR